MKKLPGSLLLALASCSVVGSLAAETVAYWRFDEGPADTVVHPFQTDVVMDVSGNGNHLHTWADYSAPRFVGETPFDSVPQSGLPNDFAMDFSRGDHDVYSEGKPINTRAFDELTIEASFKINETGRFQILVGKDGNPIGGPPPLALKINTSNQLEFRMIDGSGELRLVQSEEALHPNVWYSAAASATTDGIALWLKRRKDAAYELVGTAEADGLFVVEDHIWTVGRGMWNGGNADFFNGIIDEVRISDAVLEPGEFLGISPDPSFGQGTLLELSQSTPVFP